MNQAELTMHNAERNRLRRAMEAELHALGYERGRVVSHHENGTLVASVGQDIGGPTGGNEVVFYQRPDGSHHQALIRTIYRANMRAALQ